MNSMLQLKGQFLYKANASGGGGAGLPAGTSVKSSHLRQLEEQLKEILVFWQREDVIAGALVSVYYCHVVAKSNRIRGLLCVGSESVNQSIRGSKFYGNDPHKQHVFTHYVQLNRLEESIRRLDICSHIIDREYNGEIFYEDIERLKKKEKEYSNDQLAKSNFINVVVDGHYVEKFQIDRDLEEVKERSIVTIYKTDVKTADLLSKLGISMIDAKTIDETTIRLDPDELSILREKAPYLIAMRTYDLSKITKEDVPVYQEETIKIPAPEREPLVGVIDTLFYEDVYFKDWVTYTKMVDESIETDTDDCFHGTAVSSIIVDGPAINPDLDDGCGRFRVRHFGVATKGYFSSFSILKSIREIVAQNREIKVWNLSLGSVLPISLNFVSPEAAELDRIQSEYDVVFIVAGTNRKKSEKKGMRIGAPADSINALVVNSVDYDNQPASYHRVGPVLSFFHKPDVSYYGGDSNQKIKVCAPLGAAFVTGTSFAAPWITRKMAYLIHVLGFSREVAKALIIDSAAGWNRRDDLSHAIGYGVVPVKIEDVVQTPDDEIRFIMTGASNAYETYTYNIPVPFHNNKHPFFARATLCYFPKCSRNQGVDYTTTEMDIHFGRIKEKDGKTSISSVNHNMQDEAGLNILYEESARKLYRKWDNVKHISDTIKKRSRPRDKYGTGLWGLSIKTKERLETKNGKGLQFGVVVTLKEMNGVNRIDEFVKMCMVRGWVVNRIDIDNRFDVYQKAEEDIDFD